VKTTSVTPAELDVLAYKYSTDRMELSKRVATFQDQIAAINRRFLPGIKAAASRATDSQALLRDAIEGSPDLFVKPRTMTLHGIKVGYQKGKGKIEFDDPERVVELIEKLLPDLVSALIETKRVPVKDALKNLSVKDLRRIGCTVEETGDQIVIKAADSEVDKLVARILVEGASDLEEPGHV